MPLRWVCEKCETERLPANPNGPCIATMVCDACGGIMVLDYISPLPVLGASASSAEG